MVKSLWNNRGLQNRLNQCIFYTPSTRERAAWDVLFELLGNCTLFRLFGVAGSKYRGQRSREKQVGIAQSRLLEKVEVKHELDMS